MDSVCPVHEPQTRADGHGPRFSQGSMDFSWHPPSEDEIRRMYRAFARGKGLIGGTGAAGRADAPMPAWAAERPFVRSRMHPTSGNRNRFAAWLRQSGTVEIEIGVGRGDFLLHRVARHPERSFVGFETRTGAAIKVLDRIRQTALEGIWMSDDDVRIGLPALLRGTALAAVHVLFPDPWWKARHRHRRLFIPPFIDLLGEAMMQGGLLHIRSDVAAYMDWTAHLIDRSRLFHPHNDRLTSWLEPYQPTHREMWCQRHGHPVSVLLFQRR